MILGFFGCLLGLLLPFVSYRVFFQIKYDDDDDDDDIVSTILTDYIETVLWYSLVPNVQSINQS